MGRLSDADANNMLDVRFGGVASSAPATYYVALSTTAPTNTGTNVTEPSGGGYARVAVTNNATNFPAAAGRSKSNGTVITFPVATASWGTISHFALYDAATGGAMRAWGALATPQAVASGATADFPVGSLTITASGS
jgi:hypothetical protein